MAVPTIPRDETNKTLVPEDDQHLHHAKDLHVPPSQASTGVSSGTVSADEPSTPVEAFPEHHLPAHLAKFMAAAAAGPGPDGQPPWGVKTLAAEGPDGQPPWGTKGFAPGAAPMRDGNSGWPQGDGPAAEGRFFAAPAGDLPPRGRDLKKNSGSVPAARDGSSGWPQDDSPKDGTMRALGDGNSGWPQGDGPAQEGRFFAVPAGDLPPRGRDLQKSNGSVPTARDGSSGWPQDGSPKGGAVSAASATLGGDGNSGWPQDDGAKASAVRRERAPGTVGPEGQPPWGVKNLAAGPGAGPEGQPPWGVKNLAVGGEAGPDGQPPWGVKNAAAAAGDDASRKDA